jgi:hypothetical protein
MGKEKILSELIAMLRELQSQLGEEPHEISADTRPIGGIGGFTSITGVLFTCQCVDRFAIPNADKLQTIVVGETDSGKLFERTVGEIADEIVDRLNAR